MKVHLFIVDPQEDFCNPKGALFVNGADKDMQRLAAMVRRLKGKIDDITVTLDSHRKVDVSHPIWWKRVGDGACPNPFTILGPSADGQRIVTMKLDNGAWVPTNEEWTTYMPSWFNRSLDYLKKLAATGRYPHCIWPEHCLIGTPGHNVQGDLMGALSEWEAQFAVINYVTKGSNIWTEHFSAVKAEVPDPSDPSTQVNTDLIKVLEESDLVVTGGEALSHCLANSLRDVVAAFSDPKYVQKVVLLTDATSNVTGFDFLGDAFLKDMKALGMQTSTTTDFLR
jgi:nicotinamidase-related amidase